MYAHTHIHAYIHICICECIYAYMYMYTYLYNYHLDNWPSILCDFGVSCSALKMDLLPTTCDVEPPFEPAFDKVDKLLVCRRTTFSSPSPPFVPIPLPVHGMW